MTAVSSQWSFFGQTTVAPDLRRERVFVDDLESQPPEEFDAVGQREDAARRAAGAFDGLRQQGAHEDRTDPMTGQVATDRQRPDLVEVPPEIAKGSAGGHGAVQLGHQEIRDARLDVGHGTRQELAFGGERRKQGVDGGSVFGSRRTDAIRKLG